MRRQLIRALLLACLLGAAACSDLEPVGFLGVPAPGTAFVKGQVTAPRSVLGLSTSPEEGHALEESPVPGAFVTLTDAAGNPIPGIPVVRTDEQGGYVLTGVPLNQPFVISVALTTGKGQPLTLKALIDAVEPLTTLDVSTHTTLVSEVLLREAKGSLGPISAATFRRASEVVAANLTNTTLPDLTNREGLLSVMTGWKQANSALAASLGALEKEMSGQQPIASPSAAPSGPVQATPAGSSGGTTGGTVNAPPPVWSAAVTIRGALIIPEVITLYKGGRMVVINRETIPHSISPRDGARFQSAGVLQPGQTAFVFFNELGEHRYGCEEHPNIAGKVIVVEAQGTPPPDLNGSDPGGSSGSGGATPAPGATATPAPGATATPGPGATATPRPTPTPTPVPTPTPTPPPVGTFAGSGLYGFSDGPGEAARFRYPLGVAVDPSGNVFVADSGNHAIRKLTPEGLVATWAGSGQGGFLDGAGAAAMFFNPTAVAVDASGNVYVADKNNHCIRKISTGGQVSTFAGATVVAREGYVDGTGSAARFRSPSGVAVDAAGNVYVADTGNHCIRKITPAGLVSTLAGRGVEGADDALQPLAASFKAPEGVAVDANGEVFVADTGNSRLRRIAKGSGEVTTFAGGVPGFNDASGTSARFDHPTGLAFDRNGVLYVADSFNYRIRAVSAGAGVTTYAGGGGQGYYAGGSFADGSRETARFNYPYGVAIDAQGRVFVGDNLNHRVRGIR